MSVNYGYLISDDTANGILDVDKLKWEIENSGIATALSYIHVDDDDLNVWMDAVLSGPDADTLHALVATHNGIARTTLEQKYLVEDYVANKLQSEIWYFTDNGDDTYSDKVYEATYNWQGITLISKTEIYFWDDGTEKSSVTWNYFENGNKKIKKKAS